MLTDIENKELNFKIDQLQRSKDYEKDFTILYKKYLFKVQKMVFNTLRIKYELSERYLNNIGLYDHTVFAETMMRCIKSYSFYKGQDFYVYFWVAAKNCVIRKMKNYNKTISCDFKDNPQTICTTANNGLNTIEEIAEKYKLNEKETKVAHLLAMNTKELTNVKLMAENGIPEKTFYRMKNRIKSKIISWQNEKSDSICEKNDCL